MEELWFFVNQETHEEDVLEIIADSEALTHIVSVLCLISDEIITVQELMKSITSNNYEIFQPKQQPKQLFCNYFQDNLERNKVSNYNYLIGQIQNMQKKKTLNCYAQHTHKNQRELTYKYNKIIITFMFQKIV
ncbi:Hypothetical_protein [Hexamita inflata]|uniref:Hypothetical_protein n=1 Tax=Hexamita inflata TaxID=28002 RepID=A0AA86NAR0_9EUKA|nr:Hypothetical protein HINF_LOCUS3912 [Hexamita inflata]